MATIEELYQMKLDEIRTWQHKANDLFQENIELRELVRGYYRLLHVVHEGHWQKVMTPFWNEQRKRWQEKAQPYFYHITPSGVPRGGPGDVTLNTTRLPIEPEKKEQVHE